MNEQELKDILLTGLYNAATLMDTSKEAQANYLVEAIKASGLICVQSEPLEWLVKEQGNLRKYQEKYFCNALVKTAAGNIIAVRGEASDSIIEAIEDAMIQSQEDE